MEQTHDRLLKNPALSARKSTIARITETDSGRNFRKEVVIFQSTKFALVFSIVVLACWQGDMYAQSPDSRIVTGYSTLVEKYGLSELESGAGVLCTHPEKPGPKKDDALHFSGINFIDHNMNVPQSSSINSHASRVGRNFYGNFSYARDVSDVCLLLEKSWVSLLRSDLQPQAVPRTSSQVTSLSVAYPAEAPLLRFRPGDISEAFSRLDYAIETQDVIVCAGAPRAPDTRIFPFGCFNVIAVKPSYENTPLSEIFPYFPDRTKPEIKAPSRLSVEDSHGTPSIAAPMVGSTAALLYSAAEDEDASRSEVIRAILFAGATKKEFPGWAHTESAPLDLVHGVGELNVFNSYEILKSGRPAGGRFGTPLLGWDYGEIENANNKRYSFFIPNDVDEFSIVLAWNARVQNFGQGSDFNGETDLTNLDLELSKRGVFKNQVWKSNSIDFNVEHIYLRNPAAGFYTLTVKNDPNGYNWDYGIAWRTSSFRPQSVSDFLTTSGTELSGELTHIQTSDDNYLLVRSTTDNLVSAEFETVLPKVAPTGMKFAIESHVNSPNVFQTVEYFDFLRDQWFELDPSSPANATDTNLPREYELEGEMFDYISGRNDSNFGKVRFRVTWQATSSPPANLEVNIDQVEWEIAH